MAYLEEILLLLFFFSYATGVPLKNINRFLWFWTSSAKILHSWRSKMGCRESFVSNSCKQNTKIIPVDFKRFPPPVSKTLHWGGGGGRGGEFLAYKCEFEPSVYLRNITRRNKHHKCGSLLHSFSILYLSKLVSFLLGHVRFQACHLFNCSLLTVIFTYTHTPTTQNQFTLTQTHIKYSSSFADQTLTKVLSKEEK